ncbi:MAG: hypothetical protein KH297_04735 [Firmicutes bacterium]|nr:hypothetical protein [Bacillota bacterium]
MLILYVGKEMDGYFAAEVAKQMKADIKYVKESPHIREQSNEILIAAREGCEAIIYDVRQYIDEADTIAENILEIRKANKSKAIVVTETLNEKNVVVASCLDKQISDFITLSCDMTEQKEQLVKILTGFYDGNKREELEQIKAGREKAQKVKSKYKTIGVTGACRRIGTTTLCIQIVKYLKYKGYKACLIEMNENRYNNNTLINREQAELSFVGKAKVILENESVNKDKGIVRIEGVDMLYDQSKLSDVLLDDYDFFVYDYGSYSEKGFNKVSFLKDYKQFIVVGSSVSEMDYTGRIAEELSYRNAGLIFNFTAKEEQDDILGLMEILKTGGKGNGSRTFFMGYTPSPFILSDMHLFNSLFPEIETKEESPAAEMENVKKRSLFKRKRTEK